MSSSATYSSLSEQRSPLLFSALFYYKSQHSLVAQRTLSLSCSLTVPVPSLEKGGGRP